jgi:multidrug efflux pump subunit AcrB
VSTYKEGEDDYPINIRLNNEQRYNSESLLNQRITFRDQATGRIKQVPISAVATASKSSTFSSVKRTDLDRVITISSNVLDGYNPTETVEAIKKKMADYNLTSDFSINYTGQQEEQAEQMAFLSTALLVAVFMIFLIMVMQFNSSVTPFVIMTAVVLSLMGVFLGLVIFRMEFVIMMTMIGIISLAGIVVNNAIVLIDYTNLLFERRRRMLELKPEENLNAWDVYLCIAESGKTRLRPVLLTAITTVLGLVPLAIGLNIDFGSLLNTGDPQIYVGGDNVIFWGPMSWTIIFGLTVATFLTLVVTPVMYLMVNLLKIHLGRQVIKAM